jgi:wyosine [tRNA(Phe)-imidazoG37] synthetase (radical SAM superfamily)
MIRRTKAITDIPVAVITNGSTLHLPDVRADLALADVVMPTLSAGSPELYRTIHRPHPDLSFEQHLDGLITFRSQYEGLLWAEMMLMKGVNDSVEALTDLAAALAKVQPDQVQINIPNRPPAETWVQPPDEEGLMRAAAILGDIAQVVHPADGSFDLGGYDDVVDAIVGVITRHPMRQDQLEQTLARWAPSQVQEALDELLAGGRAQRVERLGVTFWSAAPSRYPDAAASEAVAPDRVHERMLKR